MFGRTVTCTHAAACHHTDACVQAESHISVWACQQKHQVQITLLEGEAEGRAGVGEEQDVRGNSAQLTLHRESASL